jgi:ribosomal protein L30E
MSLEELKKALKEKNIVFGTERTLKNLKLGKCKKVFLSSNCPERVRGEIKGYDVEVIELKEPNTELALICKKPHPISVLSC